MVFMAEHRRLIHALDSAEFFVDGTTIPDVDWDIGPSWSGLLPISGDANETRKVSRAPAMFIIYMRTAPRAVADCPRPSAIHIIATAFRMAPGISSSSSGFSHRVRKAVWTTSSSGTLPCSLRLRGASPGRHYPAYECSADALYVMFRTNGGPGCSSLEGLLQENGVR